MPPDLRSRLDRITNLLFSGGLNNPVTYIEQISYPFLESADIDACLAYAAG